MSRRKKLLGLLMAVGLSASMCVTPVLAETTSLLDEITEEELTDEETTEGFAEDTEYSNELAIYGLTQCHKKCAKVYLSLYLERKVNGSYGTYKYWNFTVNNATSLSKTIDVAVPSGTYYRVRGYHAASNDGLKESISTLTSGIMIK